MQPTRLSLLFGAAALMTAAAQAQQYMMVPESSNDRVMLFDAFDGTIVNLDFIVDAGGTPYDFSTPKDAIQVGSEIWVFDQLTDQIVRFDLAGNHIATILPAVGMVDNMRGAAFANNTIYVSNDGTANGATGDTVVYFDTAGNRLGQIDVSNSGTSPFDVCEYNGELLVPHFTSANDMGRYDYAGNLLGIFHSSAGVTSIDLPEQLSVTAANNVLAAGFGSPIGIYEYDSTGTQINVWPVGSGNRGVAELGNGNIMYTDGGGVHILDRGTGLVTDVVPGVSAQYVNLLDAGGGPATFCTSTPSSLAGCVSSMSGASTDVSKSAGSGSYALSAGPAPGGNQPGLFIWGKSQLAVPVLATFGWRCIPVTRGTVDFPGGTNGICNGQYDWDLGGYVNVTAGILVGDSLFAQGWYRDPGLGVGALFTDGVGPISVVP